MKHLLTLFLILLFDLLAGLNYAQSTNNQLDKKYSIQELKEDFRILRDNLEITNPMLYAYTSKEDMDNAFNQIEESINKPMTSIEFYREITALHKFIKNAHTKFDVPPGYAHALEKELPRFPFEVYYDNDVLYVFKNNSSIDTIKEGSVIKSINGEPAATLFKEFVDNTRRDGYNLTGPERMVINNFGKAYAYFKGTPSLFQLEITTPDGINQQFEISGIKLEEIKKNKLARYIEEDKPWYKSKDPLLLFKIENGIAYMTIKIFQNEYIKHVGQRFKKFLDESFATMRAEGIQELVLDLRNNGGGDDKNIFKLFSQVYNEPFIPYKNKIGSFRKIEDKKYYVERSLFNLIIPFQLRNINSGRSKYTKRPIQPSENVYNGNIYVLTNGFTFSASGYLTSLFKNYNRAIIIGEETGGNQNQCTAGIFKTLKLPHTLIKVPMWLTFSEINVDLKNTGHGVNPDYIVKPSINDVLQDKDVVMDFTKKLIHEINSKALTN